MSIPTHPIQAEANYPAWGSFLDFGEGRFGARLQGRGLTANPAVLAPRFAAVHGNSNTIVGRCEYRMTAGNSANGYEGLTMAVFALKRVGNDVQTLWWNNPLASGDTDNFINTNASDSGLTNPDNAQWRDGQIVVHIPDQYNPDWVATCWALRAQANGVCDINALQYQIKRDNLYRTSLSAANWSNFDLQGINNFQGAVGVDNGSSTNVFIRYLDTHTVSIPSGTRVDVAFSSFLTLVYILGNQLLDMTLGIGVKLTGEDGNVDYWRYDVGVSSGDAMNFILSGDGYQMELSEFFIAPKSYVSAEKFVYMIQKDQTISPGGTIFYHEGIEFNMLVGDALETGTT